MPGAYHSQFNEGDYRAVGNLALLPLKTQAKGPAPLLNDPNTEDAIDEALNLYRANCLFRNFEVKGNGDRVLIYLTLFIGECLSKLNKIPPPSKAEALKLLNTYALQSYSVPGDPNFPLNALYAKAGSSSDAELMKQYIGQLRQEMAVRLPNRIYEGDKPSKWWMSFSKRKFMGITKPL